MIGHNRLIEYFEVHDEVRVKPKVREEKSSTQEEESPIPLWLSFVILVFLVTLLLVGVTFLLLVQV